MDKPTKPTNLIPRSFGGVKNNFSASLQSSGYEDGVPVVYGGDNLNYQLDATGKELDYCEKICDYINAIPINKTPIVDANNKLVYTQYDIRVYNTTETYYENDYISGFVNDEKHIYRCKQDNVTGQSLSDDTYFERVDIMGNVKTIGRNIGELVSSTLPLTDAGLHLLDGARLSGDGIYGEFVDYIADLYAENPSANYFTTEALWQQSVTTYGVCGKFVYDSVNNTVRLPKYSNKIYTGGGTAPVIGNGMGIGLNDGTANFSLCNSIVNGVMVHRSNNQYGNPVGSIGNIPTLKTNLTTGVTTDPEKSGIIADLTNITTSLDGYYYIVVATTTKTDIEVDIDNIATDLNGKADVDLTNCTDVANIKMAHNAMPSNTYVNLTLGASDTVYTAPADGWFSVDKVAGSDWYTIYLQTLDENNNVLLSQTVVGYRTTELKGCLPVRKGQKFQMWYNASGALNYFRFIYAQGSESEVS